MDTTENTEATTTSDTSSEPTSGSGVSAPKDEIKEEDDIKEEKPDTDELDKEAGSASSQPNKVN